MTVPDNNDPRPAYEQIADDLRRQIRSGEIAVGIRLPPQRELAARYSVAAGTLQKGLDVLAGEGVISKGRTRGTFVLKMPGDPNVSPEYERLAEMIGDLSDRVATLEERMLDKVEAGRDAPR